MLWSNCAAAGTVLMATYVLCHHRLPLRCCTVFCLLFRKIRPGYLFTLKPSFCSCRIGFSNIRRLCKTKKGYR